MELVLLIDDLGDILVDGIKQELILLFFNSGDGQFTEYLMDCLKLAQLSHLLIGFIDHLFN